VAVAHLKLPSRDLLLGDEKNHENHQSGTADLQVPPEYNAIVLTSLPPTLFMFDFLVWCRIQGKFYISKMIQRHTQLPTQYFPGRSRQERETDHSPPPPPSPKLKHAQNFNSTSYCVTSWQRSHFNINKIKSRLLLLREKSLVSFCLNETRLIMGRERRPSDCCPNKSNHGEVVLVALS